MTALLLAIGSALWLGILTSISPCPLASNIAAISFISQKVDSPARVMRTGLMYMAGRMLVYAVLGILIAGSMLSVPRVSFWLQKYMNQLLGPVLVLTAMFVLGLISLPLGKGGRVAQWGQKLAESWGEWAAFPLGAVFALAFCPVSAALFFGSLIPLALSEESSLMLPLVYGLGTGLPVFAFAVAITLGAKRLASFFQQTSQFEKWARPVTGGLILLIGVWMTVLYTLKIDLFG
jgi:cytochrome c-type biogenesis protein